VCFISFCAGQEELGAVARQVLLGVIPILVFRLVLDADLEWEHKHYLACVRTRGWRDHDPGARLPSRNPEAQSFVRESVRLTKRSLPMLQSENSFETVTTKRVFKIGAKITVATAQTVRIRVWLFSNVPS